MKVSVSLPDSDVELLDTIAAESRTGRSAVVHQAVELLREARLRAEYELAADEWESSGDAAAWSTTDVDGLRHAAW
ncbi:MAG: ribbon-helix-helix protein, CopG family [Tetrasphaera sp.]|nr:ribbon-helix-helix domain-containing protein [Actinomycetota bacterium]MCB1301983.1 ribbon-helix-helix protein, CopG family [Tetrasphaera sp.]